MLKRRQPRDQTSWVQQVEAEGTGSQGCCTVANRAVRLPKRQRRLNGVDGLVISLCSKG